MRNPTTTLATLLAIASLLDANTITYALTLTAYSRITLRSTVAIHNSIPSNLHVRCPDSNSDGEKTTSINGEGRTIDRRVAMAQPTLTVLGGISALSFPSGAVAYPQEKTDKENIVKGYKRLAYLIDNWEKETVVCERTDNPYIGCERKPEKVMEYLGYKNMKDPLFRADKMLMRLQSIAPDNKYVDFVDAMEDYNESAEESSGIAYISSWGEANPGGGKDAIDRYIEKSKKDLVIAKNSLGDIIKILDLKS